MELVAGWDVRGNDLLKSVSGIWFLGFGIEGAGFRLDDRGFREEINESLCIDD